VFGKSKTFVFTFNVKKLLTIFHQIWHTASATNVEQVAKRITNFISGVNCKL